MSPARQRWILTTASRCEGTAMRIRTNVYFPPEVMRQLIDHADRKRISRSSIVEAAVTSFLSPDNADRMEAAITRRLDRLIRQVQRLERDTAIGTETLGLFIRVWMTATPSLPTDVNGAADAKGRERFENFVEVLGRRLSRGTSFLQEVPFESIRTPDPEPSKQPDG
jgi:hypothetical protein